MKLPAVPGLDIALSVDGADLKEFDDGESESDGQGPINSAASFVEAVPGGNFAVEFRTDVAFPWRHNDLELAVYLDGVYASGKVMYPRAYAGGHNPTTVLGRIEVHNGRSFHRKFAFADLTTNDGPTRPEMKEKLANIGEVTAKLYRVRKTGQVTEDTRAFNSAVDSMGVPEKALKGRAISSRATLGKLEAAAPTSFVTLEYPWGTKPFATFTFKYRSHKDLQIEGLIPRSPSPVPLEERDPDTLTAEEARELVRLQRQKLQDRAKVKKEKRERDDEEADDSDDEVEVTRQQRKRPRMSNDSGIEVIDLSNEGDSDEE